MRPALLFYGTYIAALPAGAAPLALAVYLAVGLFKSFTSEAGFTEEGFHEVLVPVPFLLPSAVFWASAVAFVYIAADQVTLPWDEEGAHYPFFMVFVCLLDLIWGVGYAASLHLHPGFSFDTFFALGVIALAGIALCIREVRVTWRRLANGRWAEIVEAMK
ncbi:hypothetical protein ACPEEZ_02470 [Frigoribacterium sp. 2-23]|uniref:hypothetical protein n=1 Tax=Frigoribacterium sp. 2-23 TaxID=3415006 RepID=UPI003C6FFE63